MVEISLSGSGEGLGLETGRGYSTTASAFYPRHPAASDKRHSVAFASDAALVPPRHAARMARRRGRIGERGRRRIAGLELRRRCDRVNQLCAMSD